MTRLHSTYSDLVYSLTYYKKVRMFRWISDRTVVVQYTTFRLLFKETLDQHCETILYTLKIHVLDHVAEDLGTFCSLDELDAWPFEFLMCI